MIPVQRATIAQGGNRASARHGDSPSRRCFQEGTRRHSAPALGMRRIRGGGRREPPEVRSGIGRQPSRIEHGLFRAGFQSDDDAKHRSVAKFELTGANSLRGLKIGLSGNAAPGRIVRRTDIFKDGTKHRRADEVPSAPATVPTETLPKIDRKRLSQLLTDAMSGKAGLLSLVPGRARFSELGKNIASARTYLRFKEEMDAERGDWHARTDKVAHREANAACQASGT